MPRHITPMAGRVFGRLTVIRRALGDQYGSKPEAFWICLCECGGERITRGTNLRRGVTRSCGCLATEAARVRARAWAGRIRLARDLTGETFGRLTAIERIDRPGSATWRCKCVCGGESRTSAANLLRGWTQSCGCLRLERRWPNRGAIATMMPA